MNPKDLVADFPSPPGAEREALLYARLLLRYLADHVYSAHLESGSRLTDATDFKCWLEEMAAATRERLQKPGDPTCPLCRHIHEDRNECGAYLSELRFCKCTHQIETTLR